MARDVYWRGSMTTIEFNWMGTKYRTNADASLVERLDGKTWNRTGSLRVRDVAIKYLASCKARGVES